MAKLKTNDEFLLIKKSIIPNSPTFFPIISGFQLTLLRVNRFTPSPRESGATWRESWHSLAISTRLPLFRTSVRHFFFADRRCMVARSVAKIGRQFTQRWFNLARKQDYRGGSLRELSTSSISWHTHRSSLFSLLCAVNRGRSRSNLCKNFNKSQDESIERILFGTEKCEEKRGFYSG